MDGVGGFANFSCHPHLLFLTLHSETKKQYLALSHRYPHLFWIISLRLFFHMIVMLFHCILKVAPGNLALLEWERICKGSAVRFNLERSSKFPVLIVPVLCGDNHDNNRKKSEQWGLGNKPSLKDEKLKISGNVRGWKWKTGNSSAGMRMKLTEITHSMLTTRWTFNFTNWRHFLIVRTLIVEKMTTIHSQSVEDMKKTQENLTFFKLAKCCCQ